MMLLISSVLSCTAIRLHPPYDETEGDVPDLHLFKSKIPGKFPTTPLLRLDHGLLKARYSPFEASVEGPAFDGHDDPSDERGVDFLVDDYGVHPKGLGEHVGEFLFL